MNEGAPPLQWDFFIAHASADAALAEELHDRLQGHCRVFLDRRCLLPGDDWGPRIVEAQRRSRATVVLVSTNTSDAYYQREEIVTAITMARRNPQQHRVIPVFIEGKSEDIHQLPYGLRSLQGISLPASGGMDGVAEHLLLAVDGPRGASVDSASMPPAGERIILPKPRNFWLNFWLVFGLGFGPASFGYAWLSAQEYNVRLYDMLDDGLLFGALWSVGMGLVFGFVLREDLLSIQFKRREPFLNQMRFALIGMGFIPGTETATLISYKASLRTGILMGGIHVLVEDGQATFLGTVWHLRKLRRQLEEGGNDL